ncbi:acyl-CoA dehydrogenase YdiO [Mycobacteroides abscessus]|nr:acyl-CoA dehydrogenase YdiO [Mycobacteroides abscessus]
MPVTSSEPSSAGSNALHTSGSSQRDRVAAAAHEVLAKHPPATTPVTDLLGAVYDAGLAWVHFPVGLGGLDAPPALQAVSDTILRAAGVPDPLFVNVIGYGMAAPTVLAHGQPELIRRILRPLFTGEELWCQLFSEPGAGSDLAGLATRAVRDGDEWVINGQKVWTSGAHQARWALLVARSNPDVAKHRGLTYFVVDMTDPGVEVRPLRQMTGDAEFNEVYLTDVRIPDAHRLGNEGDGWRVSMTTLMNERSALGGAFDHGPRRWLDRQCPQSVEAAPRSAHSRAAGQADESFRTLGRQPLRHTDEDRRPGRCAYGSRRIYRQADGRGTQPADLRLLC